MKFSGTAEPSVNHRIMRWRTGSMEPHTPSGMILPGQTRSILASFRSTSSCLTSTVLYSNHQYQHEQKRTLMGQGWLKRSTQNVDKKRLISQNFWEISDVPCYLTQGIFHPPFFIWEWVSQWPWAHCKSSTMVSMWLRIKTPVPDTISVSISVCGRR